MKKQILAMMVSVGASAFLAAVVSAKPVPDNLVNGLGKIIENKLIQEGKIEPPPETGPSGKDVSRNRAAYVAAYKAALAQEAATFSAEAIVNGRTGHYLVEIMPNGRVPVAELQSSLQARFPALAVKSVDTRYAGHGLLEGYVALNDVLAISKVEGVGTVILQLRPIHSVGAVTEYGVHMHRVNRVSTIYNPMAPHNYDGTGMSIGVMSDSYDSQPSMEGGYTTAPQDVATGDLPGTTNATNSQPVVVLQDFINPPNATNEGRAMCQIVADMAPKARIAFATADVGELGFANNIRALGGLPGYTYPPTVQQGFAGDVVCDDVSYLDEPMFQDGIVAQGVIDVVNAGVTYASSAANNWGTDGYASTFRPVPNGTGLTPPSNTALIGTNINLTGVNPALYAGGFHNFNPSGQDVAQTINTANDAGAFIFQWNDPYDTTSPVLVQPPIFTGNGTSTGGMAVDFGPFNFVQGHEYVITEMATPVLPSDNFDAIVAIIDPNGNTIVDQDTGIDETVTFFAPITGNYTIRVHPYGAMPPVYTQGPFSLKVNAANGVTGITQDFNCLFFDMSGNFISALGTNAFVNNRPYELSVPTFHSNGGFTQVQMVISRSNPMAPANAANQLKYVFFGNGLSGVGPAEYGSYLTPVTFGHSAAAGANSVAAYSAFRPNIPENFTSPGPVTIYFDPTNNRLATPQMRLKPDIAAMDGSNNTFFPLGPGPVLIDSAFDADTYPNFFGTSAASPHAAALAALVLQAHGGTHSLTPLQVKTILQLTAFPHDLDPLLTTGSATAANGGNVSIGAFSDDSRNMGTGSNDPNVFSVAYSGSGTIATLNFNPEGTAPTGGNVSGGNFTGNASGNMTADFLDPTKYNFTPGMVWTSTFSFGASVGLVAGDVSHTRSNPAAFPANPNPTNPTQHEWTLNLAFPNNNFTNGKVLRFNNSRSPWQDATTPQGLTISVLVRDNDYSADMLGSGLLIPEYGDAPIIRPGMTFNGTIVDGATTYPFNGRLTNRIGKGYSVLDGYGLINAEAATAGTLPIPGVVSRKTHGPAGDFDVSLPINGAAGVECRAPGANNSYTLVYIFDRTLATPGTASVTQGTATAAAPTMGPNPNEVTVVVSNVSNAQHLKVTLSNVQDGSGAVLTSVQARMDVLLGDTTGNLSVNASDVSQTKAQSGQTASVGNFRQDVTANGVINSSDIGVVKSQSGTQLP